MATWFRTYAEARHNPKVQRLPPAMFKSWFNLLCLTAERDGNLPPIEDIAFDLRLSIQATKTLLAELQARRLLDVTEAGTQPHNWGERQFQSDVSTARVKAFRERKTKRQGNVSETPPDTETETEKNSDANASAPRGAATRSVDPLKTQVFGPVREYLQRVTGRPEAACRKLLGEWSRDYGDGAIIEAVTAAEREGPLDPMPWIINTLQGAKANGRKHSAAGSGRRPPGDDYRAEMLEGLGIAGGVEARPAGAGNGRSRDARGMAGPDVPF